MVIDPIFIPHANSYYFEFIAADTAGISANLYEESERNFHLNQIRNLKTELLNAKKKLRAKA